ncbi:MAG: hypothetical protein ACR2QM_20685 [Longimicrobiales bacterium]
MRFALALVLVVVGSLPVTPIRAQEWSEAQQEVLDGVERCWDIWMEAVNADSPEVFQSQCQTDDSTFWVAVDGAPATDRGYLGRAWGVEVGADLAWLDLRPLHVSVNGDVAVIHFYGYWRLSGPEMVEWKRTEVWRQVEGSWRQWAGHATPVDR